MSARENEPRFGWGVRDLSLNRIQVRGFSADKTAWLARLPSHARDYAAKSPRRSNDDRFSH